ncbi:MAG: hypothetical protein JJD92_12420 [Frankiaceae bacterium]|nr:hypothetical protein [Frankiaceae bacterium]
MAGLVYFLCAVTSVACAALLLRQWRRTRMPLLMWSALGFAGLAVNNVLLFVDRVVVPDRDLLILRDASGLAALTVLLFGLIWESR